MDVREATPDDVSAVARLFGTSENAAERIVVERTVVVEEDGTGDVVGACAFDRWRDVVQVTRLEAPDSEFEALLEPAVDRAAAAGFPVEILVVGDDDVGALTEAGFEDAGPGPRFEGQSTRTFRKTP